MSSCPGTGCAASTSARPSCTRRSGGRRRRTRRGGRATPTAAGTSTLHRRQGLQNEQVGGEAPVDDEVCPSDGGSVIRGEEGAGCGNLLGANEAAQRHTCEVRPEESEQLL